MRGYECTNGKRKLMESYSQSKVEASTPSNDGEKSQITSTYAAATAFATCAIRGWTKKTIALEFHSV
jgi:hypothetical protein